MADASDRCLRELKFDGGVWAVDWSPDGARIAIGDDEGAVEVLTAEGRRLWRQVEHQSGVRDVRWSPAGRRLASTAEDRTVRVWNVQEGTVRVVVQTRGERGFVVPLSWSPDGRRLACGGAEVALLDAETGEKLDGWSVSGEREWGLSWSPDGSHLAAGFRSGRIWLREDRTRNELALPDGHTKYVRRLAWTRDGRRLASVSLDATIRVWDVQERTCALVLDGHDENVMTVGWSPDGTLLVSGSADKTVRIWSSETGEQVACLDHGNSVLCVAFSPDGTRVASASQDKTVRVWNVADLLPVRPGRAGATAREDYVLRQAATVGRQPADGSRPVALDLRLLPNAFARLARLGLAVPLSHLRTLFSILTGAAAGQEPLEPLNSHPNVRALVALRWRAAARPGLAALLLKEAPRDAEWAPPAGVSSSELRDALAGALAGEPVPVEAPTLPVAALMAAADAIDERLLTLLTLVGPDAVAADPGLPMRLLPQVPELPAMTAPKRRLLGLRLRLDQGGPAHGHGAGAERTGIDVRGDWRSMLPWQLALPEAVLRGRFMRREILYRARSGKEPPRLRPTVLVLDVSPPVFGPIERTTRLAAHVVASSLLDAGLPVVLVTAGGRGSVRTLERSADLVDIWTERSLEGADEPGVLRVARAMRETLAGDALSPVVVLLSHVFYGADEEPPEVPGLRGLFVQYPGRTVRPPLAAACERWESVGSGEVEGLGERLGRLVG